MEQSYLNKSSQDKFVLVLNLPSTLRNNDSSLRVTTDSSVSLNSIQFSVINCPVPPIRIPAVTERFAGQSVKLSSMARDPYPPATVEFKVDNKYQNYWYLWKWLDTINHSKTGAFGDFDGEFCDTPVSRSAQISDGDTYRTMISLFGKDEYNKDVIRWDYIGALITDLGEIKFSYNSPEEILCSFTFEYSQILSELIYE